MELKYKSYRMSCAIKSGGVFSLFVFSFSLTLYSSVMGSHELGSSLLSILHKIGPTVFLMWN